MISINTLPPLSEAKTERTFLEPVEALKVPMAMVGLNFGRHVIDTQLLRGVGAGYIRLSGVCDTNRGLAKDVSEASGVRAYSCLDEILEDPTISAVGLFTGPKGRADLIRKVIRAGKHVMTTKPFELDSNAADSVLAEARDLGRCVHLNSPGPIPAPDICQIEAWREKYSLGKVVGCRADVWAGYSERADGSWLDDPKKCPVAPIFRLGIYLINDLIELQGEPEEVQVFATRLVTGRPTPDNAQLGIRFRNGSLANIFASFCVSDGDHYRNSLVLNFQNGSVYRNVGPRRSIDADNTISELSLVTALGGERVVVDTAKAAASGHYRWDLFEKAIREKEVGEDSFRDKVVSGIRVVEAMSEALATGRSVPLR